MNIYDNKLIIDDYSTADYEMINTFLLNNLSIDTLEINNSEVNLDSIHLFINSTNIKNLIINQCNLFYEKIDLIDVDSLIINNIKCHNLEMFAKFGNITKLQINNFVIAFNCYYLRKLKKLQELKMNNVQAHHLGGLGYLKELNFLHLNKVPIKNWIFTTKLINLKILYLSGEYNLEGVPRFLFKIKKEEEI